MTALLTALCITLGAAVVVLFIAWSRAERRAADAEETAVRYAQRALRPATGTTLAEHWATVPREQPTLRLPVTRTHADAPTGPRRRAAHRHRIYRVDTRKDHNQR